MKIARNLNFIRSLDTPRTVSLRKFISSVAAGAAILRREIQKIQEASAKKESPEVLEFPNAVCGVSDSPDEAKYFGSSDKYSNFDIARWGQKIYQPKSLLGV